MMVMMMMVMMLMAMMMMAMMMMMTAGTSFGSAVNCLGNKKGEMTAVPPVPHNVVYCSM